MSSRSVRRVESPEAADILIDPGSLRLLSPFWGCERSVAEAAAELGVKPNTLLKQVKRLEAAGLLCVSRTRPRRGRPIKLYRTVADIFFVPYQASTASSLEEGMAHKEGFWENLFRHNLVVALEADLNGWGLKIYRAETGHLTMFPTPHLERDYNPLTSEHPATYSAWYDDLYLDFDQAKALQRELHGLYRRYRGLGGAQQYLLRLGLVPMLVPTRSETE